MAEFVDNRASTLANLRLAPIWYLLGVLMLVVVGAASLKPVPDVGVGDKVSHVVTYFVLAGWFSLLARNRSAMYGTIIGLIGYGALLELLQGLTEYRNSEWGDVFANASGVFIGVLLYFSPLPRVLRTIDSRLATLLRR